MHIWLRSEPLNSCANNYPISHHINANVSEYTTKVGLIINYSSFFFGLDITQDSQLCEK